MEYPKIHSLFKRQGWYFDENAKHDPSKQQGRQSFIPGDYSCPEFGNIKLWDVEEKIDGTNIRIIYRDGKVTFGGRTKDSQLPCHLLEYLQLTFTDSLLAFVFSKDESQPYPNVTLFGEGYGPKIQSGGYYSKEPGFCLFDVRIGSWWLEKDVVRHKISEQLGVTTPPYFGKMTEEEIIQFVKDKHFSRFALNDPEHKHVMEGVMCRPKPSMLFRNGGPIIFKLKCKEIL